LKLGESSLFQDTVKRCLTISKISEIFVVTNESQKFFVIGQIEELGLSLPDNNLLIEPVGKNTLPAICFGISEVEKIFGVSDVGIFSSDHIMDIEAMDTIAAAKDLASKFLVTFGIVPKSAHTGYGYIQPGEVVGVGYEVSEFKEKPDEEQAKKYVNNGYLWNSGMFLFNTVVFSSELSKHAPELFEAFTSNKTINEIYSDISSISVDYGLLEKSDNVAVVRLDFNWSDLGNFDAMYNEFEKDEFGNVEFICDSISKDSKGNIIQSTKEKVVSLIDIDNMVVVDTPDALLVCPRSSSQKVKDIVGVLKDRNDDRASFHRTVYRPWGSYTVMEDSERYKIKKIRVIPGKTISLQLHHHRSEHWVMVTGTACVQVDKEKYFLRQGESTFIKPGIKHRLSNPGKFALEIIEVQLGEYVGEDDIIRFEDEYGRD
jgi:mannose-1-phosphate guanylyltransferase/mannose-6-phosphate isomerase